MPWLGRNETSANEKDGDEERVLADDGRSVGAARLHRLPISGRDASRTALPALHDATRLVAQGRWLPALWHDARRGQYVSRVLFRWVAAASMPRAPSLRRPRNGMDSALQTSELALRTPSRESPRDRVPRSRTVEQSCGSRHCATGSRRARRTPSASSPASRIQSQRPHCATNGKGSLCSPVDGCPGPPS